MYDSDPSGLLVASRKRDEALVSSGEIMLVFDSFNDKENAIGFSTTPSGIRNDFTISRDGMMMGGDPKMTPLNMSWNTFWDVKTTRNQSGWFAEFRIPFSSMRFKFAAKNFDSLIWDAQKSFVSLKTALARIAFAHGLCKWRRLWAFVL